MTPLRQDKVNWIDNVEQNRVRKLLKIQFMDNHLPTAVMTQKTKNI